MESISEKAISHKKRVSPPSTPEKFLRNNAGIASPASPMSPTLGSPRRMTVMDSNTYVRPPAASVKRADKDFEMFQFEISKAQVFMSSDKQARHIFNQNEPGWTVDSASVLHLFGCDSNGSSICLHVHGFRPYLYMTCPTHVTEADLDDIKRDMNMAFSNNYLRRKLNEYVIDVEIVERTSIWYYQLSGASRYMRVTLANHALVNRATKAFSDFGISSFDMESVQMFHTNLNFESQFLIEKGATVCSWLTIPKHKYVQREEREMVSSCQLELDCYYSHIDFHDPSTVEWSHTPPLRIMAFDIEVAGRRGHFPDPEHDAVIQISCTTSTHIGGEPFHKVVFCLDSTDGIAGCDIKCYTNTTGKGSVNGEAKLLKDFSQYIVDVDPDFITGYNINGFDLKFVFERAKICDIEREFRKFSRLKREQVILFERHFQSNQRGEIVKHECRRLEGRAVLDMYDQMSRDYKLRSYSLNSVSAHFLKETKEDVHHTQIPVLFRGDSEDRRKLALYCLKDSLLVLRLMSKVMIIYRVIEMARVTGVSPSTIITSGESIKVFTQLHREAFNSDMIIPAFRNGNDGGSYTGAVVLDPIAGYYTSPISVLDFASLYPSIMIAFNICYTTFIPESQLNKVPPELVHKTPIINEKGAVEYFHFLKKNVREGLLPRVLRELLGARSIAKKDMKGEKDPIRKAVLNGRQLALKISANSVYGFTGASMGQLYLPQLASSVTAHGRELLRFTRDTVENRYSKKNGYSADTVVIYGDTDSVMIKFGHTTNVAEAIETSHDLSNYINELYESPISLEFEKVFSPYLLLKKKRYAGLLWENAEHYKKIDIKGLEAVRRDNCKLVARMQNQILGYLLIERNVEAAEALIKQYVARLLTHEIDLSLLIISKNLSRTDYKAKQPHVVLAEKMRQRDPNSAPNIGDRVPYVVVSAHSTAKVYEKAEDPMYAIDNDLNVDTKYYLERQIKEPISRLMEYVISEKKLIGLFVGDHTRKRVQRTNKKGALAGFITISKRCSHCNVNVNGDAALCPNCLRNTTVVEDVFSKKLSDLRVAEREFGRVMSECQRCAESSYATIMCQSVDCNLFYMRKRCEKNLRRCQDEVNRFRFSIKKSNAVDIEDL
ncbi:hypothetical protein PCE1_000625 [Barthelona sp. PCE]